MGRFFLKNVVGWLGKWNLLGLDLLMKERMYYFLFRCEEAQVCNTSIDSTCFFSQHAIFYLISAISWVESAHPTISNVY